MLEILYPAIYNWLMRGCNCRVVDRCRRTLIFSVPVVSLQLLLGKLAEHDLSVVEVVQ